MNSLQKYCFDLLIENSKNEVKGPIGSKLLHKDIRDLASGNVYPGYFYIYHHSTDKCIEVLKELNQSQNNLKRLKKLELLKKKIEEQEQQPKRFQHMIGFRKECFNLYFQLYDQYKNEINTFTGRSLLTAMEAYIYSGQKSDLGKFVNLVQKKLNKDSALFVFLNRAINTHIYQYKGAHEKLKSFVDNSSDVKLEFFTNKIKTNCQGILDNANQIQNKLNDDITTKLVLTDVITQTNHVLENRRDEQGVKAYLQLANKVNGHAIHWERLLSFVFILGGAIAILTGISLLPSLIGGGILGAGVAGVLAGFGMFRHGTRKGLSLEMKGLGHDLRHERVQKDYSAVLQKTMENYELSDHQAVNGNLVYSMLQRQYQS